MQASYFFRKSSQLATPVWALTPVVNVASMNATLVTIAERRMGNSPYDGGTDNPRTSVARRWMHWARYFAMALRCATRFRTRGTVGSTQIAHAVLIGHLPVCGPDRGKPKPGLKVRQVPQPSERQPLPTRPRAANVKFAPHYGVHQQPTPAIEQDRKSVV